MDIQEAIEQLKYIKEIIEQNGMDYLDERDIPVLDTAIKALEKQTNVKDKSADTEKSK